MSSRSLWQRNGTISIESRFLVSERQARTKIFNSGVKGKGGNHVAA